MCCRFLWNSFGTFSVYKETHGCHLIPLACALLWVGMRQAAVCSRSLSLELRCSSSVLSPEVISRLVRRQQQLRQEFAALSAECEEQLLTVSKDQLLERYGKTHEPTQDQDLSPQQQRQQLVMLGDEVQDKTQVSHHRKPERFRNFLKFLVLRQRGLRPRCCLRCCCGPVFVS